MTTTTEYDPDTPPPITRERPRPLGSLVAAAARLNAKKVARPGASKAEAWQEDAWDMYDLVGEQRFLATTLANRLAQARLFVGRLPDNPTEEVVPIEDGQAYDVFTTLETAGQHLDQIVGRLGINLFVAGDGWLVGVPRTLVTSDAGPGTGPARGISPLGAEEDGIDISDLDWRMLSVSEVRHNGTDEVVLKGWDGGDLTVKPDDIFLIRVWRPHPRHWAQADSPTRSSLPVLRELVGLTMHISAQVDSRLAGAGVFLIPQSADRAVRAAAGMSEDGEEESPFVAALMEAMLTPINDRASASALVPLMPVVPDESVDKFRFISFANSLDAEARNLRDEAIRRLALGQDCPPELLLGVAGMNHWGAWLVREDVVTTHLEPPLALICDALTTQFLWPVLEEQGMEPEEYRQYVIWYDVDHLITRPDRSNDAKALHAVGVISDATLRDATGFDESDAPPTGPEQDPAVTVALDLVRQAPSLAQTPGLTALVEQVRAVMSGKAVTAPEEPEDGAGDDGSGEGALPDPDETAGPETATEEPSLSAAGTLANPDRVGDRPKRGLLVTSLNVTHGGGGA